MLNWLCTKANPYTGALTTSWPTLALQTSLSPGYVERLCRRLRRKRYVFYAQHRGRGRVEVAIDKFPLPGELYTDLSACFPPGGSTASAEAAGVPTAAGATIPADVPTDVAAEVRTEARPYVRPDVTRQTLTESSDSAPPRRGENMRKDSLRGRAAAPARLDGVSVDRETALREAPPALRETLELYCYKTGRSEVSRADLNWLARLDRTHTPAVIQKAISTALARAEARGRSPATVTLAYVGASLQHFTSRRRPGTAPPPAAARRHPPGVTRLE